MSHDHRTNYDTGSRRCLARAIAKINFIHRTASQRHTRQKNDDANDSALARYTWGLFIATCVIAGAAIFTFVAALLQWGALRDTDRATHELAATALQQVNAAHEQVTAIKQQLDLMEVDQRPWVKADIEIAGDLTFDEKGASILMRHKIKNTGHSPAFSLVVSADIVQRNRPNDYQLVDDMLKQRCDEVTNLFNANRLLASGHIFFPGDSDQIDNILTIDVPKPPPPGAMSTAPPPPPLLLLSCVYYESRVGIKRPHHTGESLYLVRVVSGHPEPWREIELMSRETIPRDQLQLVHPPIEWRNYGD